MNAQDIGRLRSALALAMRAESDGASFYRMAAKSVSDTKGQSVLEELALEEDKHFGYLKRHYDQLGESGNWQDFALDTPRARAGLDAIFSKELTERVASAQFEMTALSVGIKLELESECYYRDQAKQETLAEVKRFWTALADWEKLHYQALLEQYDGLKESYWNAQGFAPF